MRELRRLAERRILPVAVPHPLVQVRVPAANVADVASVRSGQYTPVQSGLKTNLLEVLHIDRIEANDGGVQADVGFGHVLAVVVWSR